MSHHEHTFHGSATVGEKGQIVIPAEARESLNIEKGEKLLVFSFGKDALFITKPSHLEAYAQKLSQKVSEINSVISSEGLSK